MYNRLPASVEQVARLEPLRDGSLTKARLLEEMRDSVEYRKALEILLNYKTLTGDWARMEEILSIVGANPGGGDDHGDTESNATKISFNQTINGQY